MTDGFYFHSINEKYEKTALCLAVEKENIEIIKLLLTNDTLIIDVLNTYSGDGVNNKTALSLAVEKENIEIIKLLLTNVGINILNNSICREKQTSLVWSDTNDIKNILFLLQEKGIDFSIRDEHRKAPI